MKYLWRMAGKTRKHRVRNERIRGDLRVPAMRGNSWDGLVISAEPYCWITVYIYGSIVNRKSVRILIE